MMPRRSAISLAGAIKAASHTANYRNFRAYVGWYSDPSGQIRLFWGCRMKKIQDAQLVVLPNPRKRGDPIGKINRKPNKLRVRAFGKRVSMSEANTLLEAHP